jgi:general secretion pathway protein D
VYANKKNQDWISDLIKTLDKRRPQVLIDVTLVEITNTDSFNYDLQSATNIFGKAVAPLSSALSGNVTSSPIDNSAQAFYSDKHISAILTAMQSKNYGRVLAKPKILVNDGQVGMIESTTKKNIPITGASTVSNGTVVAGSISYQAYDAGITLTIQPNISEGDLLLLIVKLERSDFVQTADQNKPPDTTTNKVDTIVTVPNGKTIILGGMLKLNQNKGGNKVPLLGDIPLVGGLFRSAKDTANDSKLYVFVRANILRPEATLSGLPELEQISQRSREAFEKHEERFQNHEDWPGIKPQPVDPVKVLDAE